MVLTVAGSQLSCTGASVHSVGGRGVGGSTTGVGSGLAITNIEQRVLLTVMAQRRLYDPYSVREVLKGGVDLRLELAWTLGRVGSQQGRGILEELLVDEAVSVSRAAAFALGLLERGGSGDDEQGALLRAAAGPDGETGRLAVASLAAIGVEVSEVLRALTPLSREQRWARLLPSLHRFDSQSTTLLAVSGLEVEEPDLHAAAAFALTHDPVALALPKIRDLLADGDPRVRGWAAAALGKVGEGADLQLLLPLLGEQQMVVVVATLRAAQVLITAGKTAAPELWRPLIVTLCKDPRPTVRVAALSAAAAWLLDPELGEILVERTRGAQALGERMAALLALAVADHPRAVELTREAATSADPGMRATAARASGLLSDGELLALLSQDAAGSVRAAAYLASLKAYDRSLSAQAGGSTATQDGDVDAKRTLTSWVRIAIADADPGVRGTVLDWLVQRPILPFRELTAAVEGASRERFVATKLSAVAALVARGLDDSAERGGVIRELERWVRATDVAIRRAAVEGLSQLDEPRLAVGSAGRGRGATVYRDMLLAGLPADSIELHTSRGTVRMQLHCDRALFTCWNFLQLARQGFYDGQRFHRVVPASLVQTGDPRGDGWGGPGYTLRDEPNLLPFRRGVLGMAHSGPDTAGSQFFIALTRRPRFDGRYTAFGEVVEGLAVLDSIIEGDLLESVRVLP